MTCDRHREGQRGGTNQRRFYEKEAHGAYREGAFVRPLTSDTSSVQARQLTSQAKEEGYQYERTSEFKRAREEGFFSRPFLRAQDWGQGHDKELR